MTANAFEYYHEWASKLGDPNHTSRTFYEPLSASRLEELALMRRVNAELAEKRAAEEKAALEAKEHEIEVDVKPVEVEEDEEIPTIVKSVAPMPKIASTSIFVPSKKNVDNALFTKYG